MPRRGRRADRVRHGRLRPAAGEGAELDESPGARLAEPDLASSAVGPGRRSHAVAFRSARQRPVGLGCRGYLVRCFRRRPRVGGRRCGRAGAFPASGDFTRVFVFDCLCSPPSRAGQSSHPLRWLRPRPPTPWLGEGSGAGRGDASADPPRLGPGQPGVSPDVHLKLHARRHPRADGVVQRTAAYIDVARECGAHPLCQRCHRRHEPNGRDFGTNPGAALSRRRHRTVQRRAPDRGDHPKRTIRAARRAQSLDPRRGTGLVPLPRGGQGVSSRRQALLARRRPASARPGSQRRAGSVGAGPLAMAKKRASAVARSGAAITAVWR